MSAGNHWRVLTDSEIEQIRAGAIRVLERVGYTILNRKILERLEAKGCKTDFPSSKVRVTPDVVRRLEAAARAGADAAQNEALLRRPLPGDVAVGHNFTCYYDWTEKERRAATLRDIANVTKAWHQLPEVTHTSTCMTAQDVPVEIEPIVSAVTVMKLTDKLRSCPELMIGNQLPYIDEIETIMAGEEHRRRADGCSVNRFTVDERAAGCLMAIHERNGLESWWINSCPVAGVTAPVTLVGAVTVGIAETIGGWLAGWALNDDISLGAIPLCGIMDVKKGGVLFSTPETILMDSAMYQVFHHLYGIEIGLCTGYTDAEIPGWRAMNDKLLKSLAYGWFTDDLGEQSGTLAAGNMYSPTQQIIDLEINRQTAQLARGIQVSDEALALDDIERLAANEDGIFLTEEHTLTHWKEQLWVPELLRDAGGVLREGGDDLAGRAERKWRNALAAYERPVLDEDAIRAAEEVAERAKRDLLHT